MTGFKQVGLALDGYKIDDSKRLDQAIAEIKKILKLTV